MATNQKSIEEQLVDCLRNSERSIPELRKISKMNYRSVRRAMMRLIKSGALDRRWDGVLGKNRRYVYRLRDI